MFRMECKAEKKHVNSSSLLSGRKARWKPSQEPEVSGSTAQLHLVFVLFLCKNHYFITSFTCLNLCLSPLISQPWIEVSKSVNTSVATKSCRGGWVHLVPCVLTTLVVGL